MEAYESDSIYTFNFKGIYEGIVLDVYENNKCLINIPKMTFMNSEVKTIGKIPIKIPNLQNSDFPLKQSIQVSNGIVCKEISNNFSSITSKIGDKVIVVFLDEDPSKAYYINYSLKDNNFSNNKDYIYKRGNIEIFCDYNTIKIKNEEKEFELKDIDTNKEEKNSNNNIKLEYLKGIKEINEGENEIIDLNNMNIIGMNIFLNEENKKYMLPHYTDNYKVESYLDDNILKVSSTSSEPLEITFNVTIEKTNTEGE